MNKTHLEMMSERYPVEKTAMIIDEELQGRPPTYENVMRTPIMAGMLKSPMFPIGEIMTNLMMVYHFYCYEKFGGRTYEVKESIAEMLLNTKLDVDSRFLKSPFEEIILMVPDNLLTIHNRHTGEHKLYTIYVNFNEVSETEKTIRALCAGKENKASINAVDDALYYFMVKIEEGKVMDSLKKNMKMWEEHTYQKEFSTDKDVEITPKIFQFVLNILLYITSSDSDIRKEKSEYDQLLKKLGGLKSPSKKKKLQKKIDKTSKLSRYVVGSSVSLNPDERRIYNAVRGKHGFRYKVGGHWRMQWYGSDERYQKQKWIRPHFRGPEASEILKSIGVLK